MATLAEGKMLTRHTENTLHRGGGAKVAQRDGVSLHPWRCSKLRWTWPRVAWTSFNVGPTLNRGLMTGRHPKSVELLAKLPSLLRDFRVIFLSQLGLVCLSQINNHRYLPPQLRSSSRSCFSDKWISVVSGHPRGEDPGWLQGSRRSRQWLNPW